MRALEAGPRLWWPLLRGELALPIVLKKVNCSPMHWQQGRDQKSVCLPPSALSYGEAEERNTSKRTALNKNSLQVGVWDCAPCRRGCAPTVPVLVYVIHTECGGFAQIKLRTLLMFTLKVKSPTPYPFEASWLPFYPAFVAWTPL